METETIRVHATNELAGPMQVAHSRSQVTPVVLESGERFVLCPLDDLDSLGALFANKEFIQSLEKAVSDFEAGRGAILERGERPRPDVT